MNVPSSVFYVRSRIALEFILFAAGDLDSFRQFYHQTHVEAENKLKTFARRQRRRSVVRKSDWLADTMFERLAEHYGYGNLSEFEADVTRYARHRVVETEAQARSDVPDKPSLANPRITTRRLDSDHFVLFTTATEKKGSRALELAEVVYDAFAQEFWDCGVLMPAKLRILLFAKRRDYGLYTDVDVGRGLVLPHFSGDTATVILEGVGKDYAAQALAHEVTHGNSGWILSGPSWLREGGDLETIEREFHEHIQMMTVTSRSR